MNNSINTIVLAIATTATTTIIVWVLVSRKLREFSGRAGDSGLNFLNQNIQALEQTLNSRLDNATKIISDVTRELGQMQQIGSQLRNFQDFLRSPKLRGNLGEQGLKEMLSQALPRRYYDLQYNFKTGYIVDAVIHLGAGLIPIDAKFPLENFNAMLRSENDTERQHYLRRFKSDFRVHVQNIAKKYINPDEGTVDFAFMYIPSESIFFEVVNNEHDLFDYAAHYHVITSSPSSFFYYLRTIMLGLEGRKITEMSREILKTLKSVRKETGQLGENLGVLNRHINNSAKTISTVNDSFSRLSTKISKIDTIESQQNELLESSTDE